MPVLSPPPLSASLAEGPGTVELPMSLMQQAMLASTLQAPDAGVNIEQLVIRLETDVDPEALQEAAQGLPSAFAALRASFRWNPAPTVVVHPSARLPWAMQELGENVALKRAAFLEENRRRPFDLEQAPLARCILLRGGAQPELVWTFHHALLDGRSFAPVLRALFARYEAICRGQTAPPPAPDYFAEHLRWQGQLDFSDSRPFWEASFASWERPPALRAPQPPVSSDSAPVLERLTADLGTRCTAAAERFGVTTHTLIQGAWALVLSHYTQAEEVVFGSVRAGRHSGFAPAAEAVGLLINTVPLRLPVPLEATVSDWLRTVRARHLALRPHEQTPLRLIQEWAGFSSAETLFESLLAFENHELDALLRAGDPAWKRRTTELREHTGFPLTLNVIAAMHLRVRLSYDPARFGADFARGLLAHFHSLLEQLLIGDPARTLREIPMLPAPEGAELLRLGQRRHECAPKQSLTRWFESQVGATPDAVALTDGADALTYRELNAQANRLARQLQAAGVGGGVLVAICLTRSSRTVVAMLGVLKAGAGYVPLEPNIPAERLAFILEDTEAPVLLTEPVLPATLPTSHTQIWLPGRDWLHEAALDDSNLDLAPALEATAYVIYTSGSTGRPKGVVVAHAQVARLFTATQPWFQFGPTDVWTFFHSFAFDFSVWEIWGALLYGGRLVIVPHLLSRAPDAFHALLVREGVTVLNQTPSAFCQLMAVDEAAPTPAALALRTVIFGGEALDPRMLRGWFARHGDTHPRLVNMYGITETTVHVTYRPLRAEDALAERSVIGEPLPDLSLQVLDRFGQPCPLGVAGELQVGGAGVACGYLRQPDLTSARFLSDPFSPEPGARLYRTGDLARRLAGGELEYLGRIDAQVKIRGHRVELGEIESALRRLPGVQQAVVLADDGRLSAYLLVSGAEPKPDQMRSGLRRSLPEYMVPATFTCLPEWPLTANGKLDRARLTETRAASAPASKPRILSALERAIAEAWCEVLGVAQVEPDRNFFDAGGDSLRLLQVWARLKTSVAPGLPVVDLFAHPTVAELARHLATSSPAPAAKPNADQRRAARERNQRALRQRTLL